MSPAFARARRQWSMFKSVETPRSLCCPPIKRWRKDALSKSDSSQVWRARLAITLTLAGLTALVEEPSMSQTPKANQPMTEVKIITLDPGHFHAALIQKRMYPGVSKRVAVYAPLGFDLTEHLNRIARFNLRAEDPTDWELDIH